LLKAPEFTAGAAELVGAAAAASGVAELLGSELDELVFFGAPLEFDESEERDEPDESDAPLPL